MPWRLIPLVTGEYYHTYNRGINKQPIFQDARDYKRFLELIEFCSFDDNRIRYSYFKRLSLEQRENILTSLREKNTQLVDNLCFVLMPNHFHFLVKQNEVNGISRFMSKLQNSYTRYFNEKYKKLGPLLQGYFKSVWVEDDSQLLHLSRYIHLNPITSYVTKDVEDLEKYQWSSYMEYLGKKSNVICKNKTILSQFQTITDYQQFVNDRIEYQRKLDRIRHLVLEEAD